MTKTYLSSLMILFLILTSAQQMSANVNNSQLSLVDTYEKISSTFNHQYKKKPLKKKREITIQLSNQQFHVANSQEFLFAFITLYSKTFDKVDQISIHYYVCNPINKLDLGSHHKNQFAQIVKSTHKSLFNNTTEFPTEKEFNILNTNKRIQINSTLDQVKDIFIEKTYYKCDGAGGTGYQFKFYLK